MYNYKNRSRRLSQRKFKGKELDYIRDSIGNWLDLNFKTGYVLGHYKIINRNTPSKELEIQAGCIHKLSEYGFAIYYINYTTSTTQRPKVVQLRAPIRDSYDAAHKLYSAQNDEQKANLKTLRGHGGEGGIFNSVNQWRNWADAQAKKILNIKF